MKKFTLEDVVETTMLQELVDTLSTLTTVPMYCATPGGKVLAQSDDMLTACASLASSANAPRPCLRCPRVQLDPSGENWPDADLALALPCRLGVEEVAALVRVDGRVVGVVGSIQVTSSAGMTEAAERTLELLDMLTPANRRFVDELPKRRGEVVEQARTAAASMTGMFGRMGRLVLQEKELRERFEHLSQVDALTGTENRRQGTEAIATARELAERTGLPIALLMFDLDRFKRINDTKGHATGDEVLKGFAEVVKGVIRSGDRFFRMGGEEFVLLCSACDLDGAQRVAERIRAATERASFPVGELSPVTVSIGVYTGRGPGLPEAEAMLEAADAAMYVAKESGRNRVVLAGGAG